MLSTNSDEAGAPIHVQTIVNLLNKKINYLIIFGEEGPVAMRLRKSGFNVVVVHQMRSKISPIRDFHAFYILFNNIRKFAPDLIHAHSTKAGMLARLLGLFCNIPVLYTVHGWGWRGLSSINAKVVFFIEKALSFNKKSFYAYVSKSVEIEGNGLLGISPSQGHVIYNGVPDIGFMPEQKGPITIFMPARVSSAKDHESLVKAFDSIDQDIRLVLCGSGTTDIAFLNQLKVWAPQKNQNITCLGQRSDVPELLNETHIFALISNFEALPISVIEAMCAGKPIIASDVGGVNELISAGQSGILVEKGNVNQIAKAIIKLTDQYTRNKMGENSRIDYLSRFQSNRMVDDIYKFYLSILHK